MLADDGETVTTTRWLACRCERVSTNTRRSRVQSEAGASAVNFGATSLDEDQASAGAQFGPPRSCIGGKQQ
jgi:hypothetical protein